MDAAAVVLETTEKDLLTFDFLSINISAWDIYEIEYTMNNEQKNSIKEYFPMLSFNNVTKSKDCSLHFINI